MSTATIDILLVIINRVEHRSTTLFYLAIQMRNIYLSACLAVCLPACLPVFVGVGDTELSCLIFQGANTGASWDSHTFSNQRRNRLLVSAAIPGPAASAISSKTHTAVPTLGAYTQCRITNVGGLVQNFSGGLFSRRMGAPVSQTNAAGGSVQYSWGSGGAL